MEKQRGFECVQAFTAAGIHLPQRKTAASAGYDIEAAEDAVIAPGRVTLVPTGLKAYMQPGEVLLLTIRSSLAAKHQLMLANSVGVIDADYYDNPGNEGHIMVAITNLGAAAYTLKKGDRIAQGMFVRYETVDGDTAGSGAERKGGFGSTGRK